MLRIDLNTRHATDGPNGVTLIYAESSLRAATSFGGGGYAYRHPVAVRHDASGAVFPIRDHIMALRLGVLVVLIVTTIGRWILGR